MAHAHAAWGAALLACAVAYTPRTEKEWPMHVFRPAPRLAPGDVHTVLEFDSDMSMDGDFSDLASDTHSLSSFASHAEAWLDLNKYTPTAETNIRFAAPAALVRGVARQLAGCTALWWEVYRLSLYRLSSVV